MEIMLIVSVYDMLIIIGSSLHVSNTTEHALFVRDKAVPWLTESSMVLDTALIISAHTHTQLICLQTLIKFSRFN